MAVSDAQRKAIERYERVNVTKKTLRLYPADADVKAELESHGREWASYLKRLVREDIARRGDSE